MPFPRLALTEAALPATSTEQIKYKNLNLGSSRVTSRHQRQSSSPSSNHSRSLAICHNPALRTHTAMRFGSAEALA